MLNIHKNKFGYTKIFSKFTNKISFKTTLFFLKKDAMQLNLFNLPSDRYYQYLLILSPAEPVRSRLIMRKKEFYNKYGCVSAIQSAPHIMLAQFATREALEDRIIEGLEAISLAERPFKVALKNYEGYNHHTIFIKVMEKEPILQLGIRLRAIRNLVKSAVYPSPDFVSDPRLTIARELTPAQYEKAMKEYSRRMFSDVFTANNMLLLKRRTRHDRYQVVRSFDFRSLDAIQVSAAFPAYMQLLQQAG
jgi:hypothetical protein